MKLLRVITIIAVFITTASAQWIKQTVNTTASLRGLAVVSEKVIWASGTGGTVIKTVDSGKTWTVMTVPGAEKLDLRDIEAFDQYTAYVLSIGNGENSRIYKTTDGGATWKLQFTNNNEKAFYDAIACWTRNTCLAMSDPVDGKFVLIKTDDAGLHWTQVDTSGMPPAKEGEAAFAASGTCLLTEGKTNIFLVTGGTAARVFRSSDRGVNWSVAETPISKGTSGSGIFSIAMYDANNGVIVGGNYEKPNETKSTFAYTKDGGKTWQAGADLLGYRSGVTFLNSRMTLLAVGTSGADFSSTAGESWKKSSDWNFNSVQATWGVGPNGLVAKISVQYRVIK